MLIGYLHYRKKPFGLNRAYAFAAVAKAEGAELLYFSPGAIDGDRIHGYIYAGGEWARASSRYPDVVYNTAGFDSEKHLEAVEKLQREVPFTSFSVGDKMTVYNNLTRYGKFSDYLIPTETVLSEGHLRSLLEKYADIVLKPSSGRQGLNIHRLQKGGGIPDPVLRLIAEEEYIVQPTVHCRTKSGEPYDFRLHVQKGRGGEWMPPYIYPRISSDGEIACNISRGGHTRDLSDFLAAEFGAGGYDMERYLKVFAMQLAAHLDEIQKDLYGEELDELGIDAGLDKRLYIYEVNWRPGHPPFINIDLSVVRNTVRYAIFLAEKRRVGA